MKRHLLSAIVLLGLLCMQTAAAMHDIQHYNQPHTEVCQAYIAGDHSSAINIAAPSIPTFIAQGLTEQFFAGSHYSRITRPYFSRAPPLN